jgi:HTH-type transcriptional regulator/antitoxin HigA
MRTLKYKVIKTEKQYDEYCRILYDLDFSGKKKTKYVEDEIDLLILLIEKWDEEHSNWKDLNPVEMIISLMEDHKMNANDMISLLGISKGYFSNILHYRKGLSKKVIRKLADRFKLKQDAFNRPYKLKAVSNPNKRRKRQAA